MNAGSPLTRCYAAWVRALGYGQPVFLLLLRVLIGWGFLIAGTGKLDHPKVAAQHFADWGVPMPMVNAYAAGWTETVCGALLILGLAARLAAIPLTVTMIVAYATAHKDVFDIMWKDPNGVLAVLNDFVNAFNSAPAFPYLIAVLVVLLFGPGILSADGLIKRWYFAGKRPTAGPAHPQ